MNIFKRAKENSQEIVSLKEEIQSLRERVWRLENPFKYNVGDDVILITSVHGQCEVKKEKVKIVKRHPRVIELHYTGRPLYYNGYTVYSDKDKYCKEVHESDLTKLRGNESK